ncbi:MAG: hypothetical protein ACOZBL_02260 [Patescibacteria group bacterium]
MLKFLRLFNARVVSLTGNLSIFSIISFNDCQFESASSSSFSIEVFQIFLFGVLIILLSATLSLGFKIYLIYEIISLISILSKNLNPHQILYGIHSVTKICSKGCD